MGGVNYIIKLNNSSIHNRKRSIKKSWKFAAYAIKRS